MRSDNLNPYNIYHKIKKMKLRGNMEFTSEIPPKDNYYKILIATILSQNTNDKNSIRAFKNLEEEIGIEPSKILNTDTERLAEVIRIGGLHKIKAKKIKLATKIIQENYGGDLSKIMDLPYEEARDILLKIPGIGDKTADILLLKMGYPSFPVDTHIKRITKRLGLVNQNARYMEISNVWKKSIPVNLYLDAHMELIAFGRKICKAKNPRCDICPLKSSCRYYGVKIGKESSG